MACACILCTIDDLCVAALDVKKIFNFKHMST